MVQTQRPQQERVPTQLRTVKSRLPEPIKASLRGSTRAVGRATAAMRTDPDFLIIGAKRGGTTSLWFALTEHPQMMPLFPPLQELKSPHYFDINYHKGRSWYRSFFPTRRARAAFSDRTGLPAVAGEASPYYLFHPLAAQRIARDLPGVRLIVSLRDPVERLWSHYNERVAGHTEALGVVEAIDAEPERLRGEAERLVADPDYYSFHHDLSSYLVRGRYLEQLQPYLELFDRDQLLILRAEDYYENPLGELAKVTEHLSIEPFPPSAAVRHYNKLPRSSMPDELRARLIDYYRPHVHQLQEALDRDFDWRSFR